MDRKTRPGRPNTTEAPQLSDDAWTIIQLCWKAEPTSRPTAIIVCNKLSTLSSVYPPAVLSTPIWKTLLNPRTAAKSLPTGDTEPISRPGSPAGSRSRRATGRAFPRFWKALPMTEPYRTEGSCVMWNPNVPSKILQDNAPSFGAVTAIIFDPLTSTYVVGFKSGHVTYHHKSLASHSSSTLTLTGDDKPILCLHVLNIVAMALSLNSLNQDPVILKWCSSSQESPGDILDRLPLLGMASSSCLCAAFSSDGKEIYVGTSSGSLFICSTKDGQSVYRPLHLSSPPEGDILGPRGPIVSQGFPSLGVQIAGHLP